MNWLFHFGKYVLMVGQVFARPQKWAMYWKETMRQMNDIGVGSLMIVSIIALFIGAVTAVQFAYQLESSFIPKFYIGFILRDSIVIEMAPTLSALMLAGKVGSNIASELGSMRSSEQIDALDIMGVNTISYLVGPKVIAAVCMFPVLVTIAAGLGILGGYLATLGTSIPPSDYIRGLSYWFIPFNVVLMLVKAVVFAFIVSTVSCYQGYYVKGGALEIAKASTRAVVNSSIMILIADFLIAKIML